MLDGKPLRRYNAPGRDGWRAGIDGDRSAAALPSVHQRIRNPLFASLLLEENVLWDSTSASRLSATTVLRPAAAAHAASAAAAGVPSFEDFCFFSARFRAQRPGPDTSVGAGAAVRGRHIAATAGTSPTGTQRAHAAESNNDVEQRQRVQSFRHDSGGDRSPISEGPQKRDGWLQRRRPADHVAAEEEEDSTAAGGGEVAVRRRAELAKERMEWRRSIYVSRGWRRPPHQESPVAPPPVVKDSEQAAPPQVGGADALGVGRMACRAESQKGYVCTTAEAACQAEPEVATAETRDGSCQAVVASNEAGCQAKVASRDAGQQAAAESADAGCQARTRPDAAADAGCQTEAAEATATADGWCQVLIRPAAIDAGCLTEDIQPKPSVDAMCQASSVPTVDACSGTETNASGNATVVAEAACQSKPATEDAECEADFGIAHEPSSLRNNAGRATADAWCLTEMPTGWVHQSQAGGPAGDRGRSCEEVGRLSSPKSLPVLLRDDDAHRHKLN
ncbi:hypothetical protein HK405_012091, partial [Cladochytrium tenue]